MSLQLAAQHLASRGRGPDTQLVHMAPQEVAGLQALAKAAGGTLTTNPDTGLPEAGFLKNLLPTLIGVGLTAATGGALAPWMIGLGIGGLETARTGSLEKGLMAGLGAYGGAGIGAGLAGAGAAAPEAVAKTLGTQAATGPGSQAAMLAAQNAGFGQAGLNSLAQSAGVAAGAAPVAPSVLSAGASALGTEAGRSAALSAMGGGMGAAKYGLAAAAPAMLGSGAAQTPYVDGKPNYEYSYDADTGRYARMPVGTRDRMGISPPMFSSPVQTITPMAEGGPVGDMSERNQMLMLMANGGQMYAAGGMSHLGDYSDGGRLLKGPGDGVSDSIPATIADKRPARLADGEFVVPARIVSELGNGSTDAGARKLYAMMDRVQKARGKTTGKDRVAVNSRADKALPA